MIENSQLCHLYSSDDEFDAIAVFFRPHNISVHKKLFPPNIGTQNYLKEKEMKAKQNYEFPFFFNFLLHFSL